MWRSLHALELPAISQSPTIDPGLRFLLHVCPVRFRVLYSLGRLAYVRVRMSRQPYFVHEGPFPPSIPIHISHQSPVMMFLS